MTTECKTAQAGRVVSQPQVSQSSWAIVTRGRAAATAAALTLTFGIAGASWVVAVRQMHGMDMGVATQLGSFASFVALWVAMMAAMMLPSAAPWIAARGTPFAAGYLAVWTLFGVGAAVVQWALDRTGALSGAMSLHGGAAAALVVAGVGVYELTPFKNACLQHCRPVDGARETESSGGMRADLAAGLHRGTFCLGCCWALMALLFVTGVMNVVAMVALTAFIALEKLVPPRVPIARIAGIALLAAAAALGFRIVT
jgi:predicted metal-binding membrane protein